MTREEWNKIKDTNDPTELLTIIDRETGFNGLDDYNNYVLYDDLNKSIFDDIIESEYDGDWQDLRSRLNDIDYNYDPHFTGWYRKDGYFNYYALKSIDDVIVLIENFEEWADIKCLWEDDKEGST